LCHESIDDTVEFVTFIVLALTAIFTSAETSKVLTSLWNITEKLKYNSFFYVIFIVLITDREIEKDLGIGLVELGKC